MEIGRGNVEKPFPLAVVATPREVTGFRPQEFTKANQILWNKLKQTIQTRWEGKLSHERTNESKIVLVSSVHIIVA